MVEDSLNTEDIKYLEKISDGGFGTVYKAEWRGIIVAVKQLHCPDQKEIDILAQLEHVNIIKLLDHRISKLETVLILEYGDGGSLRSFLDKSDADCPISPELYFRWAKETALPVEYLEQHDIQHRDIKTPNIIIKNNVLKLADFGTAKKVDKSHTTSQTGTERWMAPEYMQNRYLSLSNNVYSLGLVLWELLTRELPFRKYSVPYQIMQAVIVRKERPPIPAFCPAKLAELICCCWHREPSKRPGIQYVIATIEQVKKDVLSSQISLRSQRIDEKTTEEKDSQTSPVTIKLPCHSANKGSQTSEAASHQSRKESKFQRSVSDGATYRRTSETPSTLTWEDPSLPPVRPRISGRQTQEQIRQYRTAISADEGRSEGFLDQVQASIKAKIKQLNNQIAVLQSEQYYQTLQKQTVRDFQHNTKATVGQLKPKFAKKKKKRRGGLDPPV